ncbi:MAG: GAF domain-containing sensor histidine kinase, partial [Ardenticatenales bacterium]|nr:GAF domain-containing sensor histidine kinase [Ardenticatenales bacterium]
FRVYLADVYLAKYKLEGAWNQLVEGFTELDQGAPEPTPLQLLLTGRYWLLAQLLDRWSWRYGSARGLKRERLEVLIQLYEAGIRALFFELHDDLLTLQMMVRPVYMAHLLGPSGELARAYIHYALLMGIWNRPEEVERYSQKALRLTEQLNDRFLLPYILLHAALAKHFGGQTREASRLLQRCLEDHGHWMEVGNYLKGCLDLTWSLLMRGYVKEASDWVRRAIQRVEQATSSEKEMPLHPIAFYQGVLLVLMGQIPESQKHLSQALAHLGELPDEQGGWLWASFLGHQVLIHLELGELGSPLEETIVQYGKLAIRPESARLHLRHFYVFQGYARLTQAMRAEEGERQTALLCLRTALVELERAATHPELRSHYMVIKGAYEGLQGHLRQARQHLAEAEELALSLGSPWVLFEVARHRAHLLLDEDREMAIYQARVAYHLALEHGWPNRARHIQSEFQFGDSSWGNRSGHVQRIGTPTTDTFSLKLQRHLHALLEISLASSSMLSPDKQARAALDAVVRILAAERAFLFLCEGEEGQLILRAGRDSSGQDLIDLTGYSRTVVEQVRSRRKPIIVSGTEEGALLGAVSIITHGLRSILAAPLIMQEKLIGVVYLDNHLAGGIFTEDEVEILQAISNHIAVALEIAQTIQTQAELERLQELDELKSRFFTSVSHELRTPLNSIIGFSRLLLKGIDGPITELQKQDLTMIHNSGKHLLGVINDILDLSKIAAGKMELLFEEVQLVEVIEAVIGSSILLVENKPVEMRKEVGLLPPVMADRQRLYQVLLNLISNAAKFTEKGSIIVRASTAEEKVTIQVEDTGPGIPEEKLETIFQEFGQADSAHGYSGTGLGLPISRRLIEMHGGSLNVKSKVGCGSTFFFTLPLGGPELGMLANGISE